MEPDSLLDKLDMPYGFGSYPCAGTCCNLFPTASIKWNMPQLYQALLDKVLITDFSRAPGPRFAF